jgi:hypothetical protein
MMMMMMQHAGVHASAASLECLPEATNNTAADGVIWKASNNKVACSGALTEVPMR